MTDGSALVRTDRTGPATRLTLTRPERGNALTPALLTDLLDAVAAADPDRPLVLTGAGKAFSTGGDILGFLAHAGDSQGLAAHGRDLVGLLNDAILMLRAFPAPVLAAVNGAVTGGSLGLALAADRIVMAQHAFIRPWYAAMGFAPDGGWTALLPARIGTARAQAWIAGDEQRDAAACEAIGVCDLTVSSARFEAAVEEEVRALASRDYTSIRASRHLLHGQEADLKARLEAERQAFLECLVRPETIARMRAFAASPRAGREAG